jgi:hypothetical protein
MNALWLKCPLQWDSIIIWVTVAGLATQQVG